MKKIISKALLVFFTLGAMPFSALCENTRDSLLGTVLTAGTTRIGGAPASSGTTIFHGDRIVSELPALIRLHSGSRIELVEASARFFRQKDQLVIHADEGQLRFVFNPGEVVHINAGDHVLTAVSGSRNSGQMSVDAAGLVEVNIVEGVFALKNQATGAQTELGEGDVLAAGTHSGTGTLSRNGRTLTDNSLSFPPNAFRNRCIVAGKEAYPVAGNSGTVISIIGTWKQPTGNYDYQILPCEEKALIAAGATPASAGDAVSIAVFGATQPRESRAVRNAAIILGIGAGAGIPLAIKAAQSDAKSPNSR
ncbi:MAG TPA: hypothetical protein VLL97_05670 [Acidobacteriota bacterium]|nr:hypothetical protein [Acidobacteriota bacterium]